MKTIALFLLCLSLIPAARAEAPHEHRLNTGQGIGVPGLDSIVNLSKGYTFQNPAGVMYQHGLRGTLQYAKNGVSDTGVEAGYSSDTLGIAAGVWKPGCTNCESENGAIAGASLSKFVALGLRYRKVAQTPLYGVGFLFNTDGEHRLGLNAEMTDPEGSSNNTTAYAAGYGFVTKEHSIAIDISKLEYEDPNTPDPTIQLLSVSFQKRSGPLSASLCYEKRLNDTADNNDDFWMGAGFNSTNWHLGIYAEYRQEVMAVLSGYY